MLGTFTWNTLGGDINYKKQNYVNSCFSAAYQILCANLSYRNRFRFSRTYCDIETMEYNYMLENYKFDIDEESPEVAKVYKFLETDIKSLEYSTHVVYDEGGITVDTLLEFGAMPNYTTGYILNYGNTNSYHAQAFFIKRINEEDRYIFFDSCIDYSSKDFSYYAQSCNRKREALKDLVLHNDLIHGGVMVIF